MTAAAPMAPVMITVLHAPACHFCEDADEALARLAERYLLIVERVDIGSFAGQSLVRQHRPPMTPLVLVDGAYFSAGRLPRRKLAKLLEERLSTRTEREVRPDRAVG